MEAKAQCCRKDLKMHGATGILRVVIVYYWTLAAISVLASMASIATCHWIDSLYVDGSFLIWILLGVYLSKHRRAARTWAIIISFFALTVTAAILVAGLLGADAYAHIGSIQIGPDSALFYACIVFLALVFGFPLLLLHPSARAQFELS